MGRSKQTAAPLPVETAYQSEEMENDEEDYEEAVEEIKGEAIRAVAKTYRYCKDKKTDLVYARDYINTTFNLFSKFIWVAMLIIVYRSFIG